MTATDTPTTSTSTTASDAGSPFSTILKAHEAAEAALAAAQSDAIPEQAFELLVDYSNQVRNEVLKAPAGSISDLAAKLSVLADFAATYDVSPAPGFPYGEIAASIREDVAKLFPAN